MKLVEAGQGLEDALLNGRRSGAEGMPERARVTRTFREVAVGRAVAFAPSRALRQIDRLALRAPLHLALELERHAPVPGSSTWICDTCCERSRMEPCET